MKYKATHRTVTLLSWKLRNRIWIPPISLRVKTNEIAYAINQEDAYGLKSAISKPAAQGKFSTFCNVFTNCRFKFNSVP